MTFSQQIGVVIDAPVKADVVQIAHKNARFSKYSGVLEWKNCTFLWVNIQPDADYPNKFLDGGKRMTWFGGSLMKKATPVVQRLARADGSNGDTIILFVRFEKESYVCLGNIRWNPHLCFRLLNFCVMAMKQALIVYIVLMTPLYFPLGRLGYESSNLDTSPVQFLFGLLDYHKIYRMPYFLRVLGVLGA